MIMSVCTGAYQLARAGLIDGLQATTHHDFRDDFAKEFPKVRLQRGARFVDNDRIATSGKRCLAPFSGGRPQLSAVRARTPRLPWHVGNPRTPLPPDSSS
jgi:putative intracellular protease/amidase